MRSLSIWELVEEVAGVDELKREMALELMAPCVPEGLSILKPFRALTAPCHKTGPINKGIVFNVRGEKQPKRHPSVMIILFTKRNTASCVS